MLHESSEMGSNPGRAFSTAIASTPACIWRLVRDCQSICQVVGYAVDASTQSLQEAPLRQLGSDHVLRLGAT